MLGAGYKPNARTHTRTRAHTHTHDGKYFVLMVPIVLLSVVFNRLSSEQAALQQFSYILANLLGLALAMYKCHTMGLLPTAQSDWIEFMDQRQVHNINNV